MTDPRIAALAEALQAAMYPGEDIGRDENLWIEQDTKTLAAAILAALPPDWCGHDPTLYVQVADLTERFEAAESQSDREHAEIARLRRIEEAARAIAKFDPNVYETEAESGFVFQHLLLALRAALEAER